MSEPNEFLKLTECINQAVSSMDGLHHLGDVVAGETRVSELRRRRPGLVHDNMRVISLREVDGVLRWEDGSESFAGAGRRARRGLFSRPGKTVTQLKVEELEPNQIGVYLSSLDNKLTPARNLRRWDGQSLQPVDRPTGSQRILLLVHGTFSTGDNYISELNTTPAGKAFLAAIPRHYDEVLTFDHPTVSVSPVLNALDLARFFDDCKAQVDVVCHSRGGLVVRWWLESFNGAAVGPRRVIFVGSPLAGTSLASAPRLRSTLELLTNLGHVLTGFTMAIPLLNGACGLLRLLTLATGAAANTPLADAAIALVPGLNAQARVGNNEELRRLRSRVREDLNYYAVKSNFDPEKVGWKFWKAFKNIGERAANIGADAIFPDTNDLVVDTASMTDFFSTTPAFSLKGELDFGTNAEVHHVNYFRQPRTIDFIQRTFGIPT
ncbi:MAG: hypothetical protein K1Y36_20065 [Blastocatellia bacterium]|nr:hypothetical protein [Blastocatellia bacterium]